MLTKEELTAWTTALRANPEQQISGLLSDGKGFCCLGKLCDVLGLVPTKSPAGVYFYENNYLYLPDSVADKLGSRSGNFGDMSMPTLNKFADASRANDSLISWVDIADHFDKYYPYVGRYEKSV